MAFPEVERVVYTRNPLQRVACTLVFSEPVSVGSDIPTGFKKALKKGYPHHHLEQPEMPDSSQNMPDELRAFIVRMANERSPVHKFEAENKNRAIVLARKSLTVEDLAYERREVYLDQVASAERVLRKTFGERIHYTMVRQVYLNIIDRADLGLAVAWSDLLKPELLGLMSDAFQANSLIKQTRNQIELMLPGFMGTDTEVIVRHGLAAPDDSEEPFYVIETEFTQRYGKEGAKPNVKDLIEAFSEQAGRLFRAVITDQLHVALEPELV